MLSDFCGPTSLNIEPIGRPERFNADLVREYNQRITAGQYLDHADRIGWQFSLFDAFWNCRIAFSRGPDTSRLGGAKISSFAILLLKGLECPIRFCKPKRQRL
jgi:hypothetical protein